MNLLAQSAPPVELTMTKIHAAIAGALLGAALAFYHDLNEYLKSKGTSTWDWTHTSARVGAGALGGALVVMGVTLPL